MGQNLSDILLALVCQLLVVIVYIFFEIKFIIDHLKWIVKSIPISRFYMEVGFVTKNVSKAVTKLATCYSKTAEFLSI